MPVGVNPTTEYYDEKTREFVIIPAEPHKGRGHGTIDDTKLHEMVRAGRTNAQIARHFGVSSAAVSQRISRLKHAIVREAAGVAPQIIAREIRTADQLCKINKTANDLLDTLYTTVEVKDPLSGETRSQMALTDPNLALRTMAEIRAQLKFQLEIFQTLTDAKAVKEFQETVIEVINSVDPAAKAALIKALQQKNALRSALEFR